jgi:hypothetical protein
MREHLRDAMKANGVKTSELLADGLNAGANL